MTPARLPVLGLIGAIGAGKSTAARAFAGRGGFAIDCDRLGHEALALSDVLDRLVARWGERILLPNGAPNRKAIGAIVFADAAERAFLESVVFPAIGTLARREMAKAVDDPTARFIVLDAATLLEASWGEFCDRIVYVDASEDARRNRVRIRSGWDETELSRREAAQWPAAVKKARADAVISNDGTESDLRASADGLLKEWGWLDEKECRDD